MLHLIYVPNYIQLWFKYNWINNGYSKGINVSVLTKNAVYFNNRAINTYIHLF